MSANTTFGRTSSNVLIAASPLFTSMILKLASENVCVTKRRIVGLSSAKRIVRFMSCHLPKRGGHRPPLRIHADCSDSVGLLRRLCRLIYDFGIEIEIAAVRVRVPTRGATRCTCCTTSYWSHGRIGGGGTVGF